MRLIEIIENTTYKFIDNFKRHVGFMYDMDSKKIMDETYESSCAELKEEEIQKNKDIKYNNQINEVL